MKLNSVLLLAGFALVACGGGQEDWHPELPVQPDPKPEDATPEQPAVSLYDEQYRPQIHFTPAKNWMNDPNGMVYMNGTWHLFYQYNPQGNSWGNMSWGHATSPDLMHWTEQKVALTRDHLGDIFSGSAVCDADNTAGFGAGAMVAFYTSAGTEQQQSMAYSLDGGQTFEKFNGNPILSNSGMPDFRDPKVFWHAGSKQWVMALAKGWDYAIDFYGSTNLKRWNKLSSFSIPDIARCNKGQWECPDLLQMEVDGQDKWVLLVSVNPGGPTSGSGTMYFVGQFDGKKFTADKQNYPLWMDYGMDNYAGVTWSNAPEGRHVLIGWMNNWDYAGDVPCTPWRSAMTLPRELGLKKVNGKTLLTSLVVKELDQIAGQWTDVPSNSFSVKDAWQLQVTVDLSKKQNIQLANEEGQYLEIEVNGAAGLVLVRRNSNSGQAGFNARFSYPALQAPIQTDEDKLTLNIYVDQSSVEIISEDGTLSSTNLVFPSSIYNKVVTSGDTPARYRLLNRIW